MTIFIICAATYTLVGFGLMVLIGSSFARQNGGRKPIHCWYEEDGRLYFED